jgi:glycosyltransferase involved in cell wall biosynthesis
MPVYNVEKFVFEAISSVLQQTFKEFELIIINDGSTDKSIDVINKFSKDTRIKLINQTNKGLATARNVGISKSSYNLITFLDSDDFIHERYLEILFNLYEKTKSSIVICNYNSISENSSFFSNFKNEQVLLPKALIISPMNAIKLSLNPKFYINMNISCGKLYNKKLFDKTLFPDKKFHEDEFTTYKLFMNSKKISIIPNKLLFYRQRSNSITNSYNILKLKHFIESQVEKLKVLKQYNFHIIFIIVSKLNYLDYKIKDYPDLFPTDFTYTRKYFFLKIISIRPLFFFISLIKKIISKLTDFKYDAHLG